MARSNMHGRVHWVSGHSSERGTLGGSLRRRSEGGEKGRSDEERSRFFFGASVNLARGMVGQLIY